MNERVHWFVAASYFPHLVRMKSYHKGDGEVIYDRDVPEGASKWLFFHEIVDGDEEVDAGRVPEGSACGLFFQDKDRHVLACMFTHLPLAGYPRTYQACPDDIPSAIRERSWAEDGIMYFPDPQGRPPEEQPIYGLLVAAAPSSFDATETLKNIIASVPLKMYPTSNPPGGKS